MSTAAELIIYETINIPKPPPSSAHSRSSTEPIIQRPDVFHTARLSVDGSPCTSGTERDTLSTTSSPPKVGKKRPDRAIPSIPLTKQSFRKDSSAPKSPAVPTFHKRADIRDAKSNNSPNTTPDQTNALPSTPLLNTSTTTLSENRSPAQKKAPASHSSHGIETSCGPPPSFSTQRTLSQDRLWKPTPPDIIESASQPPASKPSIEASLIPRRISVTRKIPPALTPSVEDGVLHATTPSMNESPISENNGLISGSGDDAIRTLDGAVNQTTAGDHLLQDESSKSSSGEDRKSEDLFLNLAKDTEKIDQAVRAERRKSRTSMPYLSNARSVNGGINEPTLMLEQAQFNHSPQLLLIQAPQHHSNRLSLGHRMASSAHPLDESRRQNYLSGRSAVDSIPRPYYQRNLSAAKPNATESTNSTTAPSTVWDELDDLKSRIRKLELTGKLPASSAAAMSSVERPRTATTNATTLSSSPQHAKANTSPVDSAIDGIPSTLHPLLHEALGKAKPVISHQLYSKLETTASDALQLASMLSASAPSSNGTGMPPSLERQLRRRADSMCRGLTELAIALSAESRAPSYSSRPQSRETIAKYHSPISTNLPSRRMSNDLEDRALPATRVQSRLETRRTSQLYDRNNQTAISSPETAVQTPPSILSRVQSTSGSRLSRPPAVLRNRRAHGLIDGATDDEDSSPVARPVSRAMTDVSVSGGRRFASRDPSSFSREYTSQHPMPTAFQQPNRLQRSALPSTLASGLQSRRISGSPASFTASPSTTYNPATPREGISRRYGGSRGSSTPASSAKNTPESITIERGSTPRRSFGLASRIGSTVGNRLRAARADRAANVVKDAPKDGKGELAQLQQESENLHAKQVLADSSLAYE